VKNEFFISDNTLSQCIVSDKKPQTLLLGVKLAIIVQRQ
jgi:hypothetical protein